ncbi:MAG: STAS domain-containing protein [Desulfobacterales bacterium]
MNHETEIIFKQRDDIAIFDVKGDVTALSEPFFAEAYQTANKHAARKILIKFSEDAYINSGGIAILIQLLAQTRRNGQQICITGLSNHFKKIFNMVGITKFARIYDSAEDAVKDMS